LVQNFLSSCLLSKNVTIKIVPVVLYVFENPVLKTVFGLKREKVTRVWRKLHYGDLHNM